MVEFYRLLLLLIILIYKTNGRWTPRNTYATAIMGEVTCKYESEKKVVVTLYTIDKRKKREIPISSRYAEYGRPFLISGTYKSLLKPKFYLKIYHTCYPTSVRGYIYKFVMPIHKYYVNRFKNAHFLTLLDMDLSKLKGEKISYGSYKKETKF